MKILVLAVILVLSLLPTHAVAQIHGEVAAAADVTGEARVLPSSGTFPIHIVAYPYPYSRVGAGAGFYAVQFGLDLTGLFARTQGSIVGETAHTALVNGTIEQGGVQVGSQVCKLSPTLIYTVYVDLANPVDCLTYVQVAPPTLFEGGIAMAPCVHFAEAAAQGSTASALLQVGPLPALGRFAASCPTCPSCSAVGLERTSWGRIKAMYE
jgi:hypothetical protein